MWYGHMKKQSVLCKSMSKRELEALVSLSDNELPVLLLTNIVNIKEGIIWNGNQGEKKFC